MESKKSILLGLVSVILFLIIMVGGVAIYSQYILIQQANDKIALLDKAEPQVQTEEIKQLNPYDEDNDGSYLMVGYERNSNTQNGEVFIYSELNYNYVPDKKSFLVTKEVLDNFEKNNERLTSLYAPFRPLDPFSPDEVLLSTNSTSEKKSINKIYVYNIKSNELKVYYEKQSDEGKILYLIGTDGQKVVFINESGDEIAGGCNNTWLNENIYFYDVIDKEEKIIKYQFPQILINEGRKMKAQCEEVMQYVN